MDYYEEKIVSEFTGKPRTTFGGFGFDKYKLGERVDPRYQAAYNLNKTKTNEFEYNDLGSMATIGRNKAVVDLPHFKFKGYFAWLVWMFLHLMLILSVRNKLIIFINWVWAYLTKDTSLRLILKQNKK